MSLRRWLQRPALGRARAKEAAGDLRGAAAELVAADERREATRVFALIAQRAKSDAERVGALREALAMSGPEDSHRAKLLEGLAEALSASAKDASTAPALAKTQKEEAASLFEEVRAHARAAALFEELGRAEDAARCFGAMGDVEAVERLLGRAAKSDVSAQRARSALSTYELAMEAGARAEALALLLEHHEDVALSALARELEARRPPRHLVKLRVGDATVVCLGKTTLAVGREGDIALRGASLSRHHCTLSFIDEAWTLRDAKSRNGTLVQGVAIAAAFRLVTRTEVGLGDDLSLDLAPAEDGSLSIEVRRGLDSGARFVSIGGATHALIPGRASLRFVDGWARLGPIEGAGLSMGARTIRSEIDLLIGDRVRVGDQTIEVLP